MEKPTSIKTIDSLIRSCGLSGLEYFPGSDDVRPCYQYDGWGIDDVIVSCIAFSNMRGEPSHWVTISHGVNDYDWTVPDTSWGDAEWCRGFVDCLRSCLKAKGKG